MDFGDVVVTNLPRLASGIVVDQSGHPVAQADVAAANADTLFRATTDPLGRFELHGERPGGDLWLVASASGHLDGLPVLAPAGEAEVTLVLCRAAQVEGQVILPAGLSMDGFGLDLSVEGAPTNPPGARGSSGYDYSDDGAFYARRVEPGLLRIAVRFGDFEVGERDGIVLRGGETAHVEPIDVRKQVFALTLELVDEAGAPVSGGRILSRDGESWLSEARIGHDGRAVVASLTSSARVVILAPYVRASDLAHVTDGERIVLRHALPLLLLTPPGLPEIPPSLSLQVRGWPGLESHLGLEQEDLPAAVVGPDGIATLHLPIEGRFELDWFLLHRGTEVVFEIEEGRRQAVEVREDSPSTPLLALLDPQALRAALRAAGL
jgi:hypothetical protein